MRSFVIILFFINILYTSGYAQSSDIPEDINFTEIKNENPDSVIKKVEKVVSTRGTAKSKLVKVSAPESKKTRQSLATIFIAGFIGGMAALLMPCIFPMLPLTVSFFTKGAEKGSAVKKATLYGAFIILIYVVLGLMVTIIFGADALNSLSTNGIFNFFFFLLLVFFAASFFGAFEITLPSSWINKMDANSDKGGIAGLFFMAGTLALVSFSCTGPIIGTLLVQAATTGELLGPAVGMFGFSIALAIPFTLFALFPSTLNKLPKSGGWLNSVKVVLGFLELAFALKFLSNVDLAYHWEWFDREVFLALWIVIFFLMGIYLLGKLTLAHDSPILYISVPRLLFATIILAFVMYLIPGLWGAPLKSVSAFLPPQTSQDFDLYTAALLNDGSVNKAETRISHKYADKFEAPLKLDVFFDYNEGINAGKKLNKPVLIDFTGHACVNCRKMENNVWPDKEVLKHLRNDYVIIQLYVDDKSELAPEEVVVTAEGKRLTTIGKKWSDLQTRKFQSNSQPYYVLLDPQTEQMLVPAQGADYEPKNYTKFLQSGLTAFRK